MEAFRQMMCRWGQKLRLPWIESPNWNTLRHWRNSSHLNMFGAWYFWDFLGTGKFFSLSLYLSVVFPSATRCLLGTRQIQVELLPEKVSKRSLGRLDAVLATSGSSGLPNRPYENMASSVFVWSSHSDRAAGFCLDFDNINSLSKVRSRLHPSVDYSDLDCALKSRKAITFITLFTTRFQDVPKIRELSEFQRLSKILGTIIIQHGNPHGNPHEFRPFSQPRIFRAEHCFQS